MPTFPREPGYVRNYQERVAAAQTRARIALESGSVAPHPNNPRALPGDPQRLRGIPVIGHGIGGTSPGTNPAAVR